MTNFSYIKPTDLTYRPAWQGVEPVRANLVLEGGGMRGQFTAGVLDYLMDEGLLPQNVVGVSAGALNGLNYVAGMRGRTCHLNTTYCTDWRYLSLRSLLLTGDIFGVDFCYEQIPKRLELFDYDAFARSPLNIVTVATDLQTGQADYHHLRDGCTEIDYMRASASMPLVSRTVKVDGKLLLDGGVAKSVPVEFAVDGGLANLIAAAGSDGVVADVTGGALDSADAATDTPDKTIVVLTQADGYIKKPQGMRTLARARYARYPNFLASLFNRHIEYNATYRLVKKLEAAGQIFVIRPPAPVTISHMERNPNKLLALWQTGYQTAQTNYQALQNYLA